jgi:hypothetical protein
VAWAVEPAAFDDPAFHDRVARAQRASTGRQWSSSPGRRERRDDEEAMRAAARRAGAHGDIERLSRGYATILGPPFEGGTALSLSVRCIWGGRRSRGSARLRLCSYVVGLVGELCGVTGSVPCVRGVHVAAPVRSPDPAGIPS